MKLYAIMFFVLRCFGFYAQEPKIKAVAYEGIIVGGYVDNGAFLNFTGPNINLTVSNSKFTLGMLPSLRFKEDEAIPKNSFVTPGLGFGFSYCYKLLAIQIPVYYNAKTTTKNGKWNVGIGIGLRLIEFNKHKK